MGSNGYRHHKTKAEKAERNREIYRLAKSGLMYSRIALRYDLHHSTVSNIVAEEKSREEKEATQNNCDPAV